MKQLLIIAGLLIVLVGACAAMFVGAYNRLVMLDESIKAEWAQVDNQLQRRNDLIPNLVKTVQGYAKHEKDIFIQVADARAQLAGARTVPEKIKANGALDSALSRLLAIAEAYPQLKANENFIRLQDELAGTENRIAVARNRYNDVVRDYNIMVKRFPSSIIARFTGFLAKDVYFKTSEAARQVPEVKF